MRTVFNHETGNWVRDIPVGESPAHVMTRVDTDQVHVSINGGDDVVELSKFADGNDIDRRIPTQFPGEDPAQPHAHWMSHDGHTMVRPNSNTGDSTRINIFDPLAPIVDKVDTGTLPIATGMMPDASKYYVSNYHDSTITCISIGPDACISDDGLSVSATKNISSLLGGSTLVNYNPITGTGFLTSGALPIQTPVSPDGKFVVTANMLTGTITMIDTGTDKLVKVLS
jgi:DNA-binding beta-propeller fold protein YncE